MITESHHVLHSRTKETDFSEILKFYGLSFKETGYYLQVGEITLVQGWLLHLSVITMQVTDLLEQVLPHLISEKVPFKIPVNIITCENLVGGSYGYLNHAKVVCIYPESDGKALELAEQLILLTKSFKGPEIPTDLHLGAVVYTRYGSFNPVLKTSIEGNQEKYIYDAKGNLVLDNYTVPFELPAGIKWPFDKITTPYITLPKNLLNDCIKPVAIIKPDIKGRVIKGLYFKNWFKVKYCLVKEGKSNMCADKYGRDMQDRLKWQFRLHNQLSEVIPMPKVLDFFEEGRDCYLVMEFISGISLYEKICLIYDSNSWIGLALNNRLLLLDYLLRVIKIIEKLHKRNFIHRDITPANFLIDKKDELHIIDFELTYDVGSQEPDPPFGLATIGYMSPQQLMGQTPTVAEDIYALGALMVVLFTCLSPRKFDEINNEDLEEKLSFFIPETIITALVVSCLHPDAEHRPSLQVIQENILLFRSKLLQNKLSTASPAVTIDKQLIKDLLSKAVNGIGNGIITYNGLWFSKEVKTEQSIGNHQFTTALYPGMYEGISGVLYTLAQLKNNGFVMEPNVEKCYSNNSAYLQQYVFPVLDHISGGLYTGCAGIAVMLTAGLNSNLLQSTREELAVIHTCLNRAVDSLDLASGAAGQGIATLHCLPYLVEDFARFKIDQLIAFLLKHQQKDGSWLITLEDGKKTVKAGGLSLGSGGIICFLLMAAAKYKDTRIMDAAVKALTWLQKQAHKAGNTYTWPLHTGTKQVDPYVHNGVAGIGLTFIKAYELLQDPKYKRMAEAALYSQTRYASNQDLSHAWGLAGLGQVYLEAARVFEIGEWEQRATWIAGLLLQLARKSEGEVYYWLVGAADPFPTADLMTGNSGIIHFLARYLDPGKLAFPLLPDLQTLTNSGL